MRWKRRIAALVVVTAVAALAAGVALAEGLPTTTATGRSITSVKVIRSDNVNAMIDQVNASPANRPWVDVPTASTTMSVPSNQKAFFLVTLTYVGICDASGGGSTVSTSGFGCPVRVVVNGTAASPSQYTPLGGDVQNPSGAARDDGLNSMQFSSNVVAPGTYTIKLQYRTGAGSDAVEIVHRIQTLHMTVERVRV